MTKQEKNKIAITQKTKTEETASEKNYIKPRNIKAEFEEKIKVKRQKPTETNSAKKEAEDKKESNVKKPIARHIISQDIYDSKSAHKKPTSKQNLKDKKKSKEEMQEMISLEKAMAQKHKKKVHEENENEVEVKQVVIDSSISVGDLAKKIQKTPAEIVRYLMMNGVLATVNQVIDAKTAKKVAESFDIEVLEEDLEAYIQEELKKEEKINKLKNIDEKLLKRRAPVVSIMGHVDHGKTSLLDAIRKANVTSTEAGGITQHIGAYRVNLNGKYITFLDTPGHEAFTTMRARGAQVTDIAILVVAADDGIMPQTVEAINHAKAAGVSMIVAINKMDKPGANPENIKQQLTEHEIIPEEWGGDVIYVPISAKYNKNIDTLLEMVLLVADMKELKANPNKQSKGVVIEARLDKSRGPIASVLVQRGTLDVGDTIIVGSSIGRIRQMTNYKGQKVKKAGPSTPVEIIGLSTVPEAGETFYEVKDEKTARHLVEKRKRIERDEHLKSNSVVTIDNLFSKMDEANLKQLSIIVKADVQGSVEAVKQALEKLSNDEIKVKVIHAAVGAVNESDVNLAKVSNAILIAFNVNVMSNAKEIAEKGNVNLQSYSIIYQAIEAVEYAMKGLEAPVYEKVLSGHAEVRQIFKISNAGTIAGSFVLDGKIVRGAIVKVKREEKEIFEGKISTLKRFKDDVKEVSHGFECGIQIEDFNDVKEGDILEAYTMERVN